MSIPPNFNLPPGCTDADIEGRPEEDTEPPFEDVDEPREDLGL